MRRRTRPAATTRFSRIRRWASSAAVISEIVAGASPVRAPISLGRCARSRLYDEALATALVSHLLSHYVVRPIKREQPTEGLPVGRLRRVLDYIEAHLGEDTSLRQLAELLRLSPDHFATLFRQSIGLPPHRYVLERRVARAKDLLARSPLSLAEIGYALGYTSEAGGPASRCLPQAEQCPSPRTGPRRVFRLSRRTLAGK